MSGVPPRQADIKTKDRPRSEKQGVFENASASRSIDESAQAAFKTELPRIFWLKVARRQWAPMLNTRYY